MKPAQTGKLRREIEEDQLSKLRSLLAVVAVSNPFYSNKFRKAGIRLEFSSLDDFFDRMPFTVKQELVDDQRTSPPYGSNLTFPIEQYTRLTQTSSTSGKALHWLDTPESWDWMLDSWERVYQSAGVGPGDRVFFAFSFGLFLGFWTAFDAAARVGCLRIPGGGMSSAARLAAMLDNSATVLCCTPTYALRLAEVAAEERIDLAAGKVRRIIVAGESGGSIPAVRSRIEALWPGASVVDHHGMTETGPVSYGCTARPGVLHVIESAFIAEVIDPGSGRPVPPGGRGELVLTNLGRVGSPLLRYRTGDLVERSAECLCECGSCDMALPGGILARADDMVVVRGVNIYPSAVEEILRASDGIAEYRVEIDTGHPLPELRILVEPSQECADVASLEKRLQAGLRTALGLRIAVTSVLPGVLPRFEMKAQRWVRRP
jgi:phenylacetate-CoA ligase